MDIVVKRAVLLPGPRGEGQWRLSVEATNADGETEQGVKIMPADAIEWRMAQFNVDAETAANLIVTRRHTGVRDNVYDDEPTRSAARELAISHMDQVGTVTWEAGASVEPVEEAIADSVGGDPLATLVEHSPVDDEHIAVKREWLDVRRTERRARQAQRAAEKAERVDQRRTGAERPTLVRPDAETLRERLITGRQIRPEAESSGPADVRTKETHWKQ